MEGQSISVSQRTSASAGAAAAGDPPQTIRDVRVGATGGRVRPGGGTVALRATFAPLPDAARGDSQVGGGGGGAMDSSAWIRLLLLAALMALVFWPNLRRLWLKTNPFTGEANWGHSMIVPLIGLYYLYVNRQELLSAAVRPLLPSLPRTHARWYIAGGATAIGVLLYFVGSQISGSIPPAGAALAIWGVLALTLNWGLGTLLSGLLLYAYAIWPGQNDFLKDFAMVVTLFGLVLMLGGWQVMRVAWFPIAFLVCAIPWPGLVYSWLAMPLQQLAAQVAVKVMSMTGVPAECIGTRIFIYSGVTAVPRTLNVAEACAGLRSLMTFVSIAAAVAFLSARPLWQRLLMTALAVPIAIFCNVMRVAGQGLLDHYWNPEVSQGFAHQFVGLVMLVPAFFLILLVGWILDRLFIEETERKAELIARAPAPRQAAGDLTVAIPRRALHRPDASPPAAPDSPFVTPQLPTAAPNSPTAAVHSSVSVAPPPPDAPPQSPRPTPQIPGSIRRTSATSPPPPPPLAPPASPATAPAIIPPRPRLNAAVRRGRSAPLPPPAGPPTGLPSQPPSGELRSAPPPSPPHEAP